MEAPRFRLSNFVQARASSMAKFEIIGKTVTFDPRIPSAARRAEGLVSRANALGVPYVVEATPQGTKITFTGRRKDVRRVFDPTIRSSTRRSSSGKRRSATRRQRS
jgi:hypothetical protein